MKVVMLCILSCTSTLAQNLRISASDRFKGYDVYTDVYVQDGGHVIGYTRLMNRTSLNGQCCRVAVWFLDSADNVIEIIPTQLMCVDARRFFFSQGGEITHQWSGSTQNGVLTNTRRVAVLHANSPDDPAENNEYNLRRAKEIAVYPGGGKK